MYLSELTLHDFRNYTCLHLEFDNRGAVITGPNGIGKTNILEAIHLLCTGRSPRGATRRDMIRFDAPQACVRGVFRAHDRVADTISIGFDRGGRMELRRNDRTLRSLSKWIGAGAIVAFGPADISLIYGAPGQRRRYLDILISQIYPHYMEYLIDYRNQMANRNALLAHTPADRDGIAAFEEGMARTGVAIAEMRKEILAKIALYFSEYYSRIVEGVTEKGKIEYTPSIVPENAGEEAWKILFLDKLGKSRDRDVAHGGASHGIHRDDVTIYVNGKRAREFASQGQCRSAAFALKMSAVRCLEEYKQTKSIFCVDDVFSEMDRARTREIAALLEWERQIFFASPEYDRTLLRTRVHFHIEKDGVVEAKEGVE